MAEIKVEKKKPIWPWVIGGIAILALVGFLMMGDDDNQNRDQSATRTESGSATGTERESANRTNGDATAPGSSTATGAGTGVEAEYPSDGSGMVSENNENSMADNNQSTGNNRKSDNPAAVESFVSYVKSDIGRNDLDNQKVSQAFTRLTDATNAKAAEVGYKVKNIQSAKANINKISSTAFETAPAVSIRETAELITSDLQSIQVAKFPKLDNKVEKLREASTSINPDELAMEQSEEIKEYLTEAAELLEDMK